MLGLAFIIPAYKVFDDINRRFGSEALFCPMLSDTQLYELASNWSRFYLPVMHNQAPSPSSRLVDYQSLQPKNLKLLMVSMLLFYPLCLSWQSAGGALISLGAVSLLISSTVLVVAEESLSLPRADHSTVVRCLGEVCLGTIRILRIATAFLSMRLFLPWVDPSFVVICLGGVGLGTIRTHQIATAFLSMQHHLSWAGQSIVVICLGGVGLGTIYTLQTATALLPVPIYHPWADYSIMFISIWVFQGTAGTLLIATGCRYLPIRRGTHYPLAYILIRNGRQLKTTDPSLYWRLRLEELITAFEPLQCEENARSRNSPHINFPSFTPLPPTWLLRLSFCNDLSQYHRIGQEDGLRTVIHATCWDLVRTSSAFVKALICNTSSETYLRQRGDFIAYLAYRGTYSSEFREWSTSFYRMEFPEEVLRTRLVVPLSHERSSDMLLRGMDLSEEGGPRGVFSSADMVIIPFWISGELRSLSFRYDRELLSRLIQWWCGYYQAHVLLRLRSGAVPTYDARLPRRRRLNAPQIREDNSQCSEPSEKGTQ